MQQYVIFNVLKEYCISKEEELVSFRVSCLRLVGELFLVDHDGPYDY
jgi:hypothetical protein